MELLEAKTTFCGEEKNTVLLPSLTGSRRTMHFQKMAISEHWLLFGSRNRGCSARLFRRGHRVDASGELLRIVELGMTASYRS
jgi:hypothetical protein